VAGLVKHTLFPLNKAIVTLPAGSRPANREVFAVSSNNGVGRVDVLPTGEVLLVKGSGTTGWVSLSNVVFRPSTTAFTAVVFSSGWTNYGGYAPLGSTVDTNGFVFLRGLARPGTAATICTLPAIHRPTKQRLFIAACSLGACRVDVLPTGAVTLTSRTPGTTNWPSWVSLSGISFDPSPDTAMKRGLEEGEVADLPSMVL